MNTFKTALLMIVLTGIFVLIGDQVAGQQGMIIALVLAAGMNFVAYWWSDAIVLKMYNARELSESEDPQLFRIVRNLSQQAGVPMPKVCMIPQDVPNAFATGRDPEHAVVAVTRGIRRMLNDRELEGVLAHEMSHVENRDMLISAVAATMAGALMILGRIAMFANIFGGRRRGGPGIIIVAIVGVVAALLIKAAISRSREYQADEDAAKLTGNPEGLASALSKMDRAAQVQQMQAHPSTSHLFIVNPIRGDWLGKLFSTHPPIEERIQRLRNMQLSG